jgi:8-oxo-dGTP pyrophosphatase MutT (NUDIX family)
VALSGTALHPGRAEGVTHLVDDPTDWLGTAASSPVLVVSALWWPPRDVDIAGVHGFVVSGIPAERGHTLGVPVIAGLDWDLFREGESIQIDGARGEARISGTSEVEVVTAFLLRRDGKILLLRRSGRVGTFQGRWAGVSGYLEESTPVEQAYREVQEETGINRADLKLVTTGRIVLARDGPAIYLVHPFLFETRQSRIRLDWEHTEAEWVEPTEFRRRPTVPKLDRAWESVAPSRPPKD